MALCAASPAPAAPSAVDDRGREVTLAAPARRIVSLSPHTTELLFAAGAGERVVGAVAFSDYPEAAKSIPRVGDAHAVDPEAIVAAAPDLVVAWLPGNATRRIEAMGVPVFYSDPRRLEDIPRALEALGALAGTADRAGAAAAAFRDRAAAMARAHGRERPVAVFLEIWDRPLMSVSGAHVASDLLRLCGGRNVLADLRGVAPVVDVELVLERDPEVIVASQSGEIGERWLERWKRWQRLTAVRRGNLVAVDAAMATRHTPRILDAAERVCAELDRARRRAPDPPR